MRTIVWDIEIAQPVEDFPDKWAAAREGKCGIASLALYDSATEQAHIYGPQVAWDAERGIFVPMDYENVYEGVDHLNSADLLVGFNSIGFDTPATCGTLDAAIEPQQYDILAAIWTALNGRFFKGWRLDDVADRTIGRRKTAMGAGAPKMFQRGHFAMLHDYNITDVMITKELFDYICEYGHVIGPKGEELRLPPPPKGART